MRWQRTARLAIAAFIVVFVAIVLLSLRQRRQPPTDAPASPRTDPAAVVQMRGPLKNERSNQNEKLESSLEAEDARQYQDGRSLLKKVMITLPDRNGRTVTIRATEAEVTPYADPAKGQIQAAKLSGAVTLATSDGITVTSDQGHYDDRAALLQVPGFVKFSRGRMTGSGIGATYDRARDVLWLLDKAQISVAPDPKTGGAVEMTAGAAGLARSEHYMRLSRSGHIVTDGRTIDADDITIRFTEDDQRVRGMELRGNSRITGTGAGAQNMSGRDIDLVYAEDGRGLQSARVMENAVVDLAGQPAGGSRRIAGRTIDITMSPDGATVTGLTASENVQVDIPADGSQPAKRIRSTSLAAAGAAGAGLQEATFTGNVEYHETRAAQRNLAAIDRSARAQRLVVKTQPGFGPVQQADFEGKVRITDAPRVTAEAPRIVYLVEKDELELFSSGADTAVVPHVTDGQIDVAARTIHLVLGTRLLRADTRIRSTIQPKAKADPSQTNGTGSQGRVPSMLKQDQPVFVTSNRLTYDGAASRAVYDGAARLWQGDSEIRADTLELDDKTGNLVGRGDVSTVMMLEDTDPKTKGRTIARTTGRGDRFDFDEAKHLAVYTGTRDAQANIVGPQGDVTADRIELYLKAGANELERAVATGSVFAKESNRTARGDHLTYTASDDLYVMIGTPVVAIEETPPECKKTTAPRITFKRAVESVQVSSDNPVANKTEGIPCGSERRF